MESSPWVTTGRTGLCLKDVKKDAILSNFLTHNMFTTHVKTAYMDHGGGGLYTFE